MIINNNLSNISDTTSLTQTPEQAKKCITTLAGHGVTMLSHLMEQHKLVKMTDNNQLDYEKKLEDIYNKAISQIQEIGKKHQEQFNQPSSDRTKVCLRLQKDMEEAQIKVKKNNQEVAILHAELQEATKEDQIDLLSRKLDKVCKKTFESQKKLADLKTQLKYNQLNLNKKEIKKLTDSLSQAEKAITIIIQDAQSKVAATIGSYEKADKSKIMDLAKGGLPAAWIRTLAIFFDAHKQSIQAFKDSQKAMDAASQTNIEEQPETEIDRDKLQEFEAYQKSEGNLSRRAGVIGLNNIYRFQTSFSLNKIKKQFHSFIAQDLSQIERKTIKKTIKFNDKVSFDNTLIPLNKEFDDHISSTGTITGVFTKIFGKKGISATNRQEPHLINGWESNLSYKNKVIFRSLRHGITSDKYEKDPEIRHTNSKKAAEELIKAALLQELASQKLSPEEIKEREKTGQITHLNFNSVSLVTPDNIRPYMPGQADEKQMLKDQVLALESLEKQQSLEVELDGVKISIPIQIHVNAFNFGVNGVAINDVYNLGAENQYVYNLAALNKLRDQFNMFQNNLNEEVNLLLDENKENQVKEILKINENAESLMSDIALLMADSTAYMAGDNQYEIGARILNLINVMDQGVELINSNKDPKDRLSGFKSAFNCMSGKDRTGIMDAVAKALAIMAASDKKYPSHQDLQTDPRARAKFIKILKPLLLEGGGLEITEINTGVKGYKVKKEARLLGMPLEEFLQVQGLSAATHG